MSISVSAVEQNYLVEAHNEHVIVGNSALLECVIPSFVADLVRVDSWVDSTGTSFYEQATYGNQFPRVTRKYVSYSKRIL